MSSSFMLMAADWLHRNRETNLPYDTDVIVVIAPGWGAPSRFLLCRV